MLPLRLTTTLHPTRKTVESEGGGKKRERRRNIEGDLATLLTTAAARTTNVGENERINNIEKIEKDQEGLTILMERSAGKGIKNHPESEVPLVICA